MKNQFQVQAWMFDLVVHEGLSTDTAMQRIRNEDRETYKLISKGAEAAMNELRHQWESAFGPASREYMKLTNREIKLRGDVQMALHNIETTEPRDIREIVRLVQLVAARETWQGLAQPADLVEALGLLEVAKVDVSAFQAELDSLYPPPKPDEDE